MALPNTHLGAEGIASLLEGKKNLFFAGIGGVSMNALAHISHLRGYRVSGYDRTPTSITHKLEEMGVTVYYTESEEHVKDADALIYTVAMPADNKEYAYAKEYGIPLISRADYLGYIMTGYKRRIGVSGTHGKSTTTAMIARILAHAEVDPTVFNGAAMKETGTVDMIGGEEYFAFEACEYMDSFLDFNPTVAVVLNIELDHVDYFKSIGQIRDSFTAFMNLAGEEGCAVININDKDCILAADGVKCKCITFAHENPAADYYSDNEILVDGYPEFDVFRHGELLARVKLQVPGEHSVSDALAAFAACAESGIDPVIVAEGLSSYCGICRRMDKMCVTKNGAVLYSDYAHHPTEITTTLSGVDKICRGKLNVVFQPHTFSRTAELFDDFVKAFSESGADEIVLCDIYPARETNIYGVSSCGLAEAIAKTGVKCIAADSFDAAADYINSVSSTGDVILVMGAGDVIKVADTIVEKYGE